MITIHEVKGIIQKMAALSSYISQLNQLLPQVVQLSETLHNLNEDLTLEQDRITAKLRSVEILGELIKRHVYRNPAGAGAEELSRQV